MALSAIVRTDQVFGQAYLIDVLLGHKTERMERFGHDRLPTFGVGKDLEKREWQTVFRQLVAAGLVSVDVDGHGGLRLAGDAREVLGGRRRVELRRDPAPAPATRARRASPGSGSLRPEIGDGDAGLFEALRAKRLELARAQGVPPYVVFSDRTLIEMAARRPATIGEMSGIYGIGETKLARYGAVFLDVVRSFTGAETPAEDD
jgi:ATP-dependent DNA helicase RecQ